MSRSEDRPVSGVVIRSLNQSDEAEALAAHRELAGEGFEFLFGEHEQLPWCEYVRQLELQRRGLELALGRVAETFLIADVDGRVAGRVSVRHALSPWLAEWGGHIGFGVRRGHRRRGVATALLQAGLQVAAQVGLSRTLVTCDIGNHASRALIERCGGTFERLSAPDSDGAVVRRYWLDAAG